MHETMGRRIPVDDHDNDIDLTHSVISLSLQMAWISATFAMITALCIRRKSSSRPDPSSSPSIKASEKKSDEFAESKEMANPETTMTPPSPQAARTTKDEDNTENDEPQELPLPPAMKTLRGTYSCNNLTRSMSMRRVDSSSLSMKVGRSMSLRNHDLLQNYNKKKGKLKREDSVWKKTIILGEKCRPDEEDDGIIYDNKGNKISAYHKKTHSNFSLSRTNSHIDTLAIPGQQDSKDKRIVRKDEEEVLAQQ